ncbi:hypothetical protein JX265_004727 [Neoarthrinium moseri]|uniref:NACHT domain-containing protein n=1 Tax=Neoarthrinium moseri TaxID=1658444 RepID=A0A9P9WPX0_9PEZI|nr:uncharacterized protein JN550_003771 [Neoarthrinium moseri]KAI1872897.1 hypothetical protein JN550_003771 [Neoarthrinium moseri]KAI1874519.1 hypothetical protein JX265_004727 [Neoarthrinium moseri]
MDPISALGIAAAVVQFVQFATKRCRDVQKLYETGDTSLLQGIAFDSIATDFLHLSAGFEHRQEQDLASRNQHQQVDDAIDDLLKGCYDVAREIAAIFAKLKRIQQGNHALSKIIALMQSAWKYDDITRLMEKMAAYQSQLVLRMLQHLSLTTNDLGKSHKQRFDDLNQQYSNIVQVLAVTNNRLEKLGNQGATLRNRLDQTGARDITQHNQILSAILTLQNGENHVIAPKGVYQRSSEAHAQSLMTLTAEEGSTVGRAELRGFEPIQDMALRSLYFRYYSDRHDSVKQAHSSTFNWILDDTLDAEHPASSLVQWFESGSGCYWINGKAGSGKSTLMKHVLNDPRTKALLRRWTGSSENEAACASFFFWNLGTTLQKSQEGLLRSLLYDILCQHPGLIPSVMPELRILGVDMAKRIRLEAPSLAELLRWFRRLLDQSSSQFRLFFLIDGIDEYEGDEAEVVNLLASINTAYPNVKLLISSRPLPVCVNAFESLPNMKLQDLTKDDIRCYTEELLRERLEYRHGGEWESFVEEIVTKSCGVFLWVVLVVRSLLVGLQNFDDIGELRRRLDELPSELKDLYAAMFRHLPQIYRKQASELFQMCLMASEEQEGEHRLTPMQLHYAGWDVAKILQLPVDALAMSREKEIVDSTEGRIRARCAGILELRSVNFKLQGLFSSQKIRHFYVEFIHRSAVEFLRYPDVWEEISSLTVDSGFHPAVGLCHSCVLLCKTSLRESPIILDESDIWYYMQRAMHYAHLAEREGRPVLPSILQELDRTMTSHWEDTEACYITRHAFDAVKGSKSERKRLRETAFYETNDVHWAAAQELRWEYAADDENTGLDFSLRGAAKPIDFYSMAGFYCLADFLQQLYTHSSLPQGQARSVASRLLFDTTNNMLFRRPWPGNRQDKESMALRCPVICSYLLDQGADPNARYGISQESAWQLMLEYGVTNQTRQGEFWRNFEFGGFANTYSRLLVNFVQHGADVNAEVVSKKRQANDTSIYRPTFSPLGAVKALYSPANPMDPFAIRYQPRTETETRSEELVLFYEHLKSLMIQKGAVRELLTRDQTGRVGSSGARHSSHNDRLGPPKVPQRPKSADMVKGKLRSILGKWQSTKGSAET